MAGKMLTDLCRVGGEGGIILGFRKDILTENLLDRDNAFLVCTRCQGILREACMSTTSGEQFCSCCIKKGEQTHPNAHVRNTVLSLKCSCPLYQRGCEWLGTLGECENHLDVCGQVHEKCKLGCKIVLPRHELFNHTNEKCNFREIPCEHCQRDFKVCDMPNHLEKCPKMPLTCELGCGMLVCREVMVRHLEEKCVEKKVECPFIKYMCGVGLVKRKELNQHLEEKRTEHTELKLSAMEEIVMKQNERIDKQNEIIERMSLQMYSLKTEVELLTYNDRDPNQSLQHLNNVARLDWRINSIETYLGIRKFISDPPKQLFVAAGYYFTLTLGTLLPGLMEINFLPHAQGKRELGYDELNWPFKAEFMTRLVCHSNPKCSKEFWREMVQLKREDFRNSIFTIARTIVLASFHTADITAGFIKDGGIEFEIFVMFK